MADSELEPDAETNDEADSPGLSRFAAGLLCGAVLGAGLALLFAPHRGDHTRRQLQRRLERLREHTADGITRADALRRELRRRKSR
jgi:gas vesicle protein